LVQKPQSLNVKMCTAGVYHFTEVSLAKFVRGGTAKHCNAQ